MAFNFPGRIPIFRSTSTSPSQSYQQSWSGLRISWAVGRLCAWMFAGLLRRASVTSAHTRLRAMAQASSTSPAGGIRTDKLDLGAASGREGVVLLACGSFNPPHKVHVRMLELAGDALSRTGVQVLGAYMSPVSSRYEKKGLVDAKHRVAMCEAAVRDSALVMVEVKAPSRLCGLEAAAHDGEAGGTDSEMTGMGDGRTRKRGGK